MHMYYHDPQVHTDTISSGSPMKQLESVSCRNVQYLIAKHSKRSYEKWQKTGKNSWGFPSFKSSKKQKASLFRLSQEPNVCYPWCRSSASVGWPDDVPMHRRTDVLKGSPLEKMALGFSELQDWPKRSNVSKTRKVEFHKVLATKWPWIKKNFDHISTWGCFRSRNKGKKWKEHVDTSWGGYLEVSDHDVRFRNLSVLKMSERNIEFLSRETLGYPTFLDKPTSLYKLWTQSAGSSLSLSF